jgi:hypothetical protein
MKAKENTSEHKLSIWSWFLLIIISVIVCGLYLGRLGFIPAIRIGWSIGYLLCIFVALSQKGQKLEGCLSFACVISLNLIPFYYFRRDHIASFGEYVFIETTSMFSFAMWLFFAILAIRMRRTPNRVIGFMSLISIISPGILDYMDTLQADIFTWMGYEWWHVRPFQAIADFLWYSYYS